MSKGRRRGKMQEKPDLRTVPVKDQQGNIVAYDMYVDGEWIGSRSTIRQCEEIFNRYK